VAEVEFVGPFRHYDVAVNGWRVPLIDAALDEDNNKILLSLDDRIGLLLSEQEAQRFVPFLAHCIAHALGFGAHPGLEDKPPLRRSPPPTDPPVRLRAASTAT